MALCLSPSTRSLRRSTSSATQSLWVMAFLASGAGTIWRWPFAFADNQADLGADGAARDPTAELRGWPWRSWWAPLSLIVPAAMARLVDRRSGTSDVSLIYNAAQLCRWCSIPVIAFFAAKDRTAPFAKWLARRRQASIRRLERAASRGARHTSATPPSLRTASSPPGHASIAIDPAMPRHPSTGQQGPDVRRRRHGGQAG